MLETGKHDCQPAYSFINEIVQTYTKRNSQWNITSPRLIFHIYHTATLKIWSEVIFSILFIGSLLWLPHSLSSPLSPTSRYILRFYTSFKTQLVPHPEVSSVPASTTGEAQRAGASGKARSQTAWMTWGKWLPFPTLSFILVKMEIIVVAPALLLWRLNKLIVSGTQ